MKNDLHMHSNFSACANVNNTWENLLIKMQERGLERISITDHDTCIFHVISKFRDAKKFFKGEIIPGMECDVVEDGITFELLAYNFDVMKIFNWSYEVYGTLEIRQNKIKDKLLKLTKERGFLIDENMEFNGKVEYAHKYIFENLQKFCENDWLFKKYGIENLTDFYRLSTTTKDFPLYMDMLSIWPSVDEVVNAIHAAGGIVVLAHPFNYKNIEASRLLKIIEGKKIDGIEVYHPSCTPENIEFLLDYAKKRKLVVTGGSDYHGTEHENSIGIANIDEAQCEISL